MVLRALEETEGALIPLNRAVAITIAEECGGAERNCSAAGAIRFEAGVADFLTGRVAQRQLLSDQDRLAQGETVARPRWSRYTGARWWLEVSRN